MAKEAPTMSVAVDDSGGSARSIENDMTAVDFTITRNQQDTTGIDKAAIERLLLLSDCSITMNGVFNDATNMSHDVAKTVASATASRTITLVMSGQTLAVETFLTEYGLSRASSGELTFTIPAMLQSGAAPTWA
jgi:hypothetical protein